MKIQESRIREINSLHAELESLAKTGMAKATRIGEILTECKGQIPHGQFTQWICDNCSFSVRTAQNYMKLYLNRARLQGADSVSTAYSLLKNETVSQLRSETRPPEFCEVQESVEKYIAAQVDQDASFIAASDHCEKAAFWIEYIAASIDNNCITDVLKFEERLTWLQDRLGEARLRAQRTLGMMLGEIHKQPADTLSLKRTDSNFKNTRK